MTRNRMFILAGLTAAGLGLAAAGAIAHRGDDRWDGPGGRHGWGHDGHRGAMGLGAFGLGIGSPVRHFCRGDASEMADHMLVRLEHQLKPTDAQKATFEDFKTATRSAANKIMAACPKTDDKTDTQANADKATQRPMLSPVERLAQTEAGLEASLDAIKTMRPAAEKFYASLSDAQKAELIPKRRPHWDRRGGKDGDGAGEPGPGAAPDAPESPQK